jgi:hypothetical protein
MWGVTIIGVETVLSAHVESRNVARGRKRPGFQRPVDDPRVESSSVAPLLVSVAATWYSIISSLVRVCL